VERLANAVCSLASCPMSLMLDSATTNPAVSVPVFAQRRTEILGFNLRVAIIEDRLALVVIDDVVIDEQSTRSKDQPESHLPEKLQRKYPAANTSPGSMNLWIFSALKGTGSSDVPIYMLCHSIPALFLRVISRRW